MKISAKDALSARMSALKNAVYALEVILRSDPDIGKEIKYTDLVVMMAKKFYEFLIDPFEIADENTPTERQIRYALDLAKRAGVELTRENLMEKSSLEVSEIINSLKRRLEE